VTKAEQARERELFRRLADDTLSAAEFAAVEQRLLTDAAFRARYVRAMGIEARLHEAFRFPGTYRAKEPPRTSPIGVFAFGGLCASLLLGLSGWMFWTFGIDHPGVVFNESALPGLKPVAIVTRAPLASGGIEPGTRIKPGVLTVHDGQVQLEFLNGAQVNLEGPAELHIVSVDAATLISGKAAARIPPGARGFILSTPDAAIVDLGTEFAVSVEKSGDSEIHVVDGQVDVSLLGNDGNTLTSQRVSQADSLRLTRRPAVLERIETPSVSLPGMQAQNPQPLRVTADYERSVRASQPDVYWRFEELVDGKVPNAVGPRWAGAIHASPEDSEAIVVRDGVARFTPSEFPHRLEPDAIVPGLNRESFSVEMWVSVSSFHWATFIAVVPDEAADRNLHMTLLELPYKSSLVYTPGSFRFLHRLPPGDHGGTNLFTEGDCTPGLWHHLVAVKTPAGMKLYLNGRMIREIAETEPGDDMAYRFYLGQLYEGQIDRQLDGAIDEFALYLRELTDQEINEHYRAMIDGR